MKNDKLFSFEPVNYGVQELSYGSSKNDVLENTEITGSGIFIRIKIIIISIRIEILRCPKLRLPFLYTIINLRTHRTEINHDKLLEYL